MSGPSKVVSIVPSPLTSWQHETTIMGYSQPAPVGRARPPTEPLTVANVRLSPSFGAGSCVDAADVPLTVAIAMLGVVLLPDPPPLPARAGATASVRPPATNANVSAIWRFIAASPLFPPAARVS